MLGKKPHKEKVIEVKEKESTRFRLVALAILAIVSNILCAAAYDFTWSSCYTKNDIIWKTHVLNKKALANCF